VIPSPAPAGPHPSRLALSEYLSGDAAPEARSALEAHVAGCPDCGSLLREAQAARDAFAARYPSLEYLKATRRARSPQAPAGFSDRMRAWWKAVSARPAPVLAVLLLLAILIPRLPWKPAPPDLSAKGAARIVLFLDGKSVGDTVACRPGDTLQLGIVSERPVHYAILYRDDEGPLLAYMDEGRGTPLGKPGGENVPHSLILNPGWSRERLYGIWSYDPFDSQSARDRAEGRPAASLSLHLFLLLNSP
jgi:hypothetical protein